MDFNGFMQILQTIIIGLLGFVAKRYLDKNDKAIADNSKKIDDTITKFDNKTREMIAELGEDIKASISKLDEKIAAVEKRSNEKSADLQKQLHAMKEEMPLVYTLREDFLRVMNGVDDKLNRILYSRNGGNNSE